MRTLQACALCVVMALADGGRAAAQEPSLATVLQRAAMYVTDFHRRLSSIVAEEHYVQQVWHPPGALYGKGPAHRELRSDLLLVKPAGARNWLQFRDVFEVDGRPVRDRNERLIKLFLEPSASWTAQTAGILKESARYNIGTIERTVNTPVLSLLFLEPTNQPRFKFRRANDRRPQTRPDSAGAPGHFGVTTEMWVVQFEEIQPGTLIRTADGKDLFSKGRFWIEPSTGRVLMSELIVTSRAVLARIDVSYQSAPLLGLLVPIEMRERYDGIDGERIDGAATYGQFRQFQVNVDEKLAPIVKP